MLPATVLMIVLGLGASLVLAVASRVFYVWEDPRLLKIADALPGANCGGCGFAGCSAAAEAIAKGEAPPDMCVAGGFDTAKAIAALLGMQVEQKEPELASTSCTFGTDEADAIYLYSGALDCRAAVQLYGGSKLCPIGCIGLGACVKACKFDAVTIGKAGLPIFNPKKCVACGACVEVCPKNIISLTSATRRIAQEITTDECSAPCEQTCPTGIQIPDYILAVREGRYEDALLTIKEKCPLPLVCGRICPAPCELNCRRAKVDAPVAINPLKRFAAEYELQTGRHVQPYKCPDSGKRAAVIGGGAEGLSLAYYLARLGHKPAIIEAKPELGGILRYVISEDRLPRKVLDHEIRGILDMGVEARTNAALGRDVTLSELLADGFDAVALTQGGYDSRKILHPGQPYRPPIQGLMTLLDFLAETARGERIEIGRHVVVARGGLKALEVARACRERGAQRVTLVSEQRLSELPKEMRDENLPHQGIFVRTETIVAAFGGVGDRMTRLAFELLPQASENEMVREMADVDLLIVPGGRLPEFVCARLDENGNAGGTPAPQDIKWQTVEAFRSFPFQGGMGVLSPPETQRASDSAAVVKSIISGRRLARVVHQHFSEGAVQPISRLAAEAEKILDVEEVHDVELAARRANDIAPAEPGSLSSWIFPAEVPELSESEARAEAERCLQCGLICYKKKAV